MGLFDLYRSTARCATSTQEILEQDIAQTIIDNWQYQVNAYTIYRNFDYNTNYSAIINDEKNYKKLVSEKRLIMYPFQQIFSGDYVHWKYDGQTLSDWLVFSVDKQYRYKESASMRKCNNSLKWIDENGFLKSYPCVIEEPMSGTDFSYNKYIVTSTGNITCFVQKNADTSTISINKRFIMNNGSVAKVAYKVRSIDDFFQDTNILILTMNVVPLMADDDVYNFIANKETYQWSLTINQNDIEQEVGFIGQLSATLLKNGEIDSSTLVWNSSDDSIVTIDQDGYFELVGLGSATITCYVQDNPILTDTINVNVVSILNNISETRISPNVEILYKGEPVTFTVFEYINEEVQADTFTFTHEGESSKYKFTAINGNTFVLESLGYAAMPLTVLCKNNITDVEVQISLTLRDYW